MKLSRTQIDLSVEKQMLIGMITSDKFLREVYQIFDPDYIHSGYIRIIAQWCITHWEKYEQAPMETIQETYKSWQRKNPDDEDIEAISKFLESISDEYERTEVFNVDYVLDQTEELFRTRYLENLKEDLGFCLEDNDLDEAEELLLKFRKVERPQNESIDPFRDEDDIIEAFEEAVEPLFQLSGALGDLVNDLLVRQGLVAFQGPEKRGKTWWLLEMAKMANFSRLNVVMFQAGDMSKNEALRRIYIGLSGKSNKRKYCGEFYVPQADCKHNQENTCFSKKRTQYHGLYDDDDEMLSPEEADDIGYEACTACRENYPKKYAPCHSYRKEVVEEPLTGREALKYAREWTKVTKNKRFKLDTYPNDTLTVSMIEHQLDVWQVCDNFVADVIVIDYADILASEGMGEFRHQENKKWKALRALAQKRNCLVIVATQAAASAYSKDLMDESDFSEDKRKYSHVTGMITLNQTAEEKQGGVMRLGTLFVREGEFDKLKTVTVLQSIRQGRPCLDSYHTPRRDS